MCSQGDAVLRNMERASLLERQLWAILSGDVYRTNMVNQGTKFNNAAEHSGKVRFVR